MIPDLFGFRSTIKMDKGPKGNQKKIWKFSFYPFSRKVTKLAFLSSSSFFSKRSAVGWKNQVRKTVHFSEDVLKNQETRARSKRSGSGYDVGSVQTTTTSLGTRRSSTVSYLYLYTCSYFRDVWHEREVPNRAG